MTSAIDSELFEIRLPASKQFMGEAAGDADFAVRFIENDDDSGEVDEVENGIRTLNTGEERKQDVGLHVPKGTESLKFSRRKQGDAGVTEKRAWVVSPGKCYLRIWSYRC